MIPQRHRIEADRLHQRGIGFALEQGMEQRAGGGISGVQLQQIGRALQFAKPRCRACHAADFDTRRNQR